MLMVKKAWDAVESINHSALLETYRAWVCVQCQSLT